MELSGVALLDHLQFLISGIDNESARALLQFLAGLPPNLWIQIRASTLLPDMITACAKHPLDLATLVYLLTQSPSTMSAIPSSCIQTCLSVLDGECSPVQNGTASCTNEGRSQSRRRRKRKLSNDCTDSSETVSVLSLPENCKLAYNRPSLLMGHSLSRATQDPSFASSLYQQQQFLYLIGKLINSDYEGALTDPYAAFRLYKCMCILENLASLENLQSCKKKDLMHCVLEWIQQVLTLDSDLWIRNESEYALLPSIFAALRALTNLTNRDVDICATFCSAQGIEAAVNIVGLCKEGVSNSSTACDLVTITTALLTNCAEVNRTVRRQLCGEPVLIEIFNSVSPTWQIAITAEQTEGERLMHCRTVAGYISLLLSVLYLECSDQRESLSQMYSLRLVADILQQFSFLTKVGHPEQIQMIDEITSIHRKLTSCIELSQTESEDITIVS